MSLAAGDLNRRIAIQRRQSGTDEAGQPLSGWEPFLDLWSRILGQTGMGSIRQASAQDGVAASMNSYSFRVRYREDLTDAMRVVYGGLPFDIKQVRLDLDRKEWTDLVCEQGGNDG